MSYKQTTKSNTYIPLLILDVTLACRDQFILIILINLLAN